MKHLVPGHTARQGLRWAVNITTVHTASQVSTLSTQMVTVLRQVLKIIIRTQEAVPVPLMSGVPSPTLKSRCQEGPPSHLKANSAPAKQSQSFCDPLGDLNSEWTRRKWNSHQTALVFSCMTSLERIGANTFQHKYHRLFNLVPFRQDFLNSYHSNTWQLVPVKAAQK